MLRAVGVAPMTGTAITASLISQYQRRNELPAVASATTAETCSDTFMLASSAQHSRGIYRYDANYSANMAEPGLNEVRERSQRLRHAPACIIQRYSRLRTSESKHTSNLLHLTCLWFSESAS